MTTWSSPVFVIPSAVAAFSERSITLFRNPIGSAIVDDNIDGAAVFADLDPRPRPRWQEPGSRAVRLALIEIISAGGLAGRPNSAVPGKRRRLLRPHPGSWLSLYISAPHWGRVLIYPRISLCLRHMIQSGPSPNPAITMTDFFAPNVLEIDASSPVNRNQSAVLIYRNIPTTQPD